MIVMIMIEVSVVSSSERTSNNVKHGDESSEARVPSFLLGF